jgi:hypothetical protein
MGDGEMKLSAVDAIQNVFHQLPQPQQLAIIYQGALWRLADLQKRQFLAQAKVSAFEETYQHTLQEWVQHGLPDDASLAMHEDYILWHHWAEVASQTEGEIQRLEELISQGPPSADLSHVSN